MLGDNVPKRGGAIAPKLAKLFLKLKGWTIVGDIETDMPKIYDYYKGVVPKHPKNLSKPLKILNRHL